MAGLDLLLRATPNYPIRAKIPLDSQAQLRVKVKCLCLSPKMLSWHLADSNTHMQSLHVLAYTHV